MNDLIVKNIPLLNNTSKKKVDFFVPILNAFEPTRKVTSVATSALRTYSLFKESPWEGTKQLLLTLGYTSISYFRPGWESKIVLGLQLVDLAKKRDRATLMSLLPTVLSFLGVNSRCLMLGSLALQMGSDFWSGWNEERVPEKYRDYLLVLIRGYQFEQHLKPVRVITQDDLEELFPEKVDARVGPFITQEQRDRERAGEIYLENLGDFFEEAKPWLKWMQEDEAKFVPPPPLPTIVDETGKVYLHYMGEFFGSIKPWLKWMQEDEAKFVPEATPKAQLKEPARSMTIGTVLRSFYDVKTAEAHQYERCRFKSPYRDSNYNDHDFSDVVFKKCNFNNFALNRVTFNKCQFINSTFKNVSFKDSKFIDSWIENSTFKECNFSKAEFLRTGIFGSKFINCEFFEALASASHVFASKISGIFADEVGFILSWGSSLGRKKPVIGTQEAGGEWQGTIPKALNGEMEVLKFNYADVFPQVDSEKLRKEVQGALIGLDSKSKERGLSIGALILNRAAPGSEIDKIRQRAREIVSKIDGLTIPGGDDIEPELYGQKKSKGASRYEYAGYGKDLRNSLMNDTPNYEHSLMEIALILEARWRNIPIWGTCRGCQIINVAFGGTLHQHVKGQSGKQSLHIKGDHPVQERLRQIAGPLLFGYSEHHQAADEMGQGLFAAVGYEGVKKAFLSEDGHVIGTQFHPEYYVDLKDDKRDAKKGVGKGLTEISRLLEYVQAKRALGQDTQETREAEKTLKTLVPLVEKVTDIQKKILEEAAEANKRFFIYFVGLARAHFEKHKK